MKYDGLSESQKEESSWEDNALKVQRISDAEKKDTDGASKPLQKSLSHTSPFSSAPSFNLLLPLQLLPPSLPLLPSPPLLRSGGWCTSLSPSPSHSGWAVDTSRSSLWECVWECVCVKPERRAGLPDPLLKLYLSHKHRTPLSSPPHQCPRTHPRGVHLYPHDRWNAPHMEPCEPPSPVSLGIWFRIASLGRSSRRWIFWSKEGLQRSRLSQWEALCSGHCGLQAPLGWRPALQHHGLPSWDFSAVVWGGFTWKSCTPTHQR